MKKITSIVNIFLAITCLVAVIMNFTNSNNILMEIAYIIFTLMFGILGVKGVYGNRTMNKNK